MRILGAVEWNGDQPPPATHEKHTLKITTIPEIHVICIMYMFLYNYVKKEKKIFLLRFLSIFLSR